MTKILLYFISICLFAIMFSSYHYYVLNLEYLKIIEFSKSLPTNQIDKTNTFSHFKESLNYLVVVVNMLAKVLSVTIVLFIGCIIFEAKIKFKQLQIIVIKAEFVFLLPILFEIVYFKFGRPIHSYSDIQYFSSLSLLNLFDYKKIDAWFVYPLQTLNFFEVIYWLILAYYIGKNINFTSHSMSTTNKSLFGLKIVAFSYGSILFLWVTIQMFLVLNNS